MDTLVGIIMLIDRYVIVFFRLLVNWAHKQHGRCRESASGLMIGAVRNGISGRPHRLNGVATGVRWASRRCAFCTSRFPASGVAPFPGRRPEMNRRKFVNRALLAALLLHSAAGWSARFVLPTAGNDLVGELKLVTASRDATLLDIARSYDVGQNEIQIANPQADRWLPGEGTAVLIPSHYILPDARRRGLVLNLPEMRIYHFPATGRGTAAVVDTYPASVGRMDWKTPLGETRIMHKQRNPSWTPPASIRKEAAAAGTALPDVIPPGPDNPLGDYALRLGLPGYLIHGTNKPYGVGMRVTHGCVRLLPEDIEELFDHVSVGTPVQILNRPVKTGWQDGVLYIEVHPPLDEDEAPAGDLLRFTLEQVYAELEKRPVVLDGQALRSAVEEMHGVPVAVSKPGLVGRPIGNPLFR